MTAPSASLAHTLRTYSARSTSAVDVRAALSPGNTATKAVKTSVPTPINMTEVTGTVASGTALMLRAKSVHISRPATTPSGIPTIMPTTASTIACQVIAAVS